MLSTLPIPWCSLSLLSPCPALQLYSPAGRHLTAPLKLGAGIAKLACDSAWRLLVLTTSGAVRLFDVEALRSLLTASLAPLLEDGCTGGLTVKRILPGCVLGVGSHTSQLELYAPGAWLARVWHRLHLP